MAVSGAFGEIVFDRRGFIRRKGIYHNPKMPQQGNLRQAMAAAPRCIKLCGPETRQQLRAVADQINQWSAYLTKQFLGPKRVHYRSDDVDRTAWETAATEAGLKEIRLDYAQEAPVSPGAQLFLLAMTLYELGIYDGTRGHTSVPACFLGEIFTLTSPIPYPISHARRGLSTNNVTTLRTMGKIAEPSKTRV
jgi:hypothetical protein